jgi:hypothetical protein
VLLSINVASESTSSWLAGQIEGSELEKLAHPGERLWNFAFHDGAPISTFVLGV